MTDVQKRPSNEEILLRLMEMEMRSNKRRTLQQAAIVALEILPAIVDGNNKAPVLPAQKAAVLTKVS